MALGQALSDSDKKRGCVHDPRSGALPAWTCPIPVLWEESERARGPEQGLGLGLRATESCAGRMVGDQVFRRGLGEPWGRRSLWTLRHQEIAASTSLGETRASEERGGGCSLGTPSLWFLGLSPQTLGPQSSQASSQKNRLPLTPGLSSGEQSRLSAHILGPQARPAVGRDFDGCVGNRAGSFPA